METTTRMPLSGATLPETLSCRNPGTRELAALGNLVRAVLGR
ncbi:MAG: hypothetical protein JWM53_6514 [bacterium]|nr:hypothetical protein [bacterium]